MKSVKLVVGIVLVFAVAGLIYINLGSEEASMTSEQPTTQGDKTGVQAVGLELDARDGVMPNVTSGIPHIQLDQTSSDETYDKLAAQTYAIDGILDSASQASLPGARAISVVPELAINQSAMIVGREFAHIHAGPGRGSLHLVLSATNAAMVVEKGWGVYHPFALDGSLPGMVMVFAPRDGQDVATIIRIVEASFGFATLEQ